jgi:hypothetical protein
VVNTDRNARGLRPFRMGEFGRGKTSPSPPHLQAANRLISSLRGPLFRRVATLQRTATSSARGSGLDRLLQQRERAERGIKLIERIWDFYLEIFGQRTTRFGRLLHACDRVADCCYQAVYSGLGTPRRAPSPGPFTSMETGITPATFRRGVRLTRLGKRANPFPLIQLPYHRLLNPWTLGALHHEVSHNLQSDLGLWQEVPLRIARELRTAGHPEVVVNTWRRWHKEVWADLAGLLLGGPEIVASLMDVVARNRRRVRVYNPTGVHPTPILRVPLNIELLCRMDFPREAAAYEAVWRKLYRGLGRGSIPQALIDTFEDASSRVVQVICFQGYPQLGGRSLRQILPFGPREVERIRSAARILARSPVPASRLPPRFLVGAARIALDRQLAPPRAIAKNFYQSLSRGTR